ncbi:Acg family FMN-binding oxidoreductase [Qaidamihabitans albus]|uniref:Acg family FMN-binding oxidoreductase n=1 Tax=Qaidamihabitans albus TaxID=2795733 RepID=UPI0018F11277|nr:NAD(P)H nitroreductase [Qaidamihabitans albus]
MDPRLPDDDTVGTALALAGRAPSVHNSQPWQWRIGGRTLHLYADPRRRLREADPDGHDLVLSCGAALHHLRVAFAALGWRTDVHRLPNPAEPDHLAAVELHRQDPGPDEITLAAAIPRRRTDRRRYSSWPVHPAQVAAIAARAADEGALLRAVDGPAERHQLVRAMIEASQRHAADPAYRIELAVWSGRHGSADGVPARNVPPAVDVSDAAPMREFTDPRLAQPSGSATEPDAAVLLVLSTASDDRLSRLRAGEATSAALLTATAGGLACCPLTEPLEFADTRALLRDRVTGGNFPQMVLRTGWTHVNADPLPATPRRPFAEIASGLGEREVTR